MLIKAGLPVSSMTPPPAWGLFPEGGCARSGRGVSRRARSRFFGVAMEMRPRNGDLFVCGTQPFERMPVAFLQVQVSRINYHCYLSHVISGDIAIPYTYKSSSALFCKTCHAVYDGREKTICIFIAPYLNNLCAIKQLRLNV